jgi:hypothetical protein
MFTSFYEIAIKYHYAFINRIHLMEVRAKLTYAFEKRIIRKPAKTAKNIFCNRETIALLQNCIEWFKLT